MKRYSHGLVETSQAIREGRLELMSYIEKTCLLLEELDSRIEAFLPENGRLERLKKEGEDLLKRYPGREERPPLFGILVGVKDIYRVDGFPTKVGSKLPPEMFAGREAWAVQRLRTAGALILGKTVTTEFAYFAPGPTRNPVNPRHTPGGSSSGSAAAVAAGMCALALGTQTIGSVIRPAAFCGVFGFKPSYGRIPGSGLIDFSPSMDHPGIFTQDLAGIELAARILCTDWRDAGDNPRLQDAPILGIPEGPYLEQASSEGLEAFRRCVGILERHGYKLKPVKVFENIQEINERHRKLIFGEMARVHENWYPNYQKLYRPQTEEAVLQGQKVTSGELAGYRREALLFREELGRIMRENGVDIWASPAAAGPAPEGLETTGSPLLNLPWTHAGVPALTIPAGKAQNGLPLGLQLTAAYGEDEILLRWAQELEGCICHGF